jgi:hypothetical protein
VLLLALGATTWLGYNIDVTIRGHAGHAADHMFLNIGVTYHPAGGKIGRTSWLDSNFGWMDENYVI